MDDKERERANMSKLRTLLADEPLSEKLRKHVPKVICVDNIRNMVDDVKKTVKDYYNKELR